MKSLLPIQVSGVLLSMCAPAVALAQAEDPVEQAAQDYTLTINAGDMDQLLDASGVPSVPEQYRLVSSLYQAAILAQTMAPAVVRESLGESFMPLRNDGFFEVEIVAPLGVDPPPDGFIRQFGAIPSSRWENYLEVHVPMGRLLDMAAALPQGYLITRATAGEPDDVTGEGPQRIGSDTYRDGGADGTGKTIAIIDGGYQNLTATRNNGDAPTLANTTLVNYTPGSFEASGFHGTGCVEAAFDHCPGATWRVYKINSVADLGLAVADGNLNGVDVFSHSMSRYNLGWNDNEGGACTAAVAAANSGALFFTSAGNRAEHHFKDTLDPSAGDWNQFSGSDDALDITLDPNEGFNFSLCWDPSGGTHNLDMYLYNSSLSTILRSSTSSGETYENFSYTNTSSSTIVVKLAIKRVSGGTPVFEVFGHGLGDWQYATAASSVTSPSNTSNQNVISVAAVDQADFVVGSPDYGVLQPYSSQGPSNSGMIVPDITGPTNTAGFTYTTFGGTSSATPNAAGAACAFWSSVPAWTNSSVRWVLFRHGISLVDWGSTGNDNVYGWGGANITTYAPGTVWLARDWLNTLNNPNSPFYTLPAAYSFTPNGGRILILEGGNYPELFPTMSSKIITIETVDEPAVIGS
ncbi:MAG: hypothetical protein ACI8QC_002034 [Planctomycetota bacterium]|jgi:hypothetical protein